MSEPTPKQIARYLDCVTILSNFEAKHQFVRGWGAFDPKEWPDKPDPDVVAVRDWLTARSADQSLNPQEKA